jgi:hypothetical protein
MGQEIEPFCQFPPPPWNFAEQEIFFEIGGDSFCVFNRDNKKTFTQTHRQSHISTISLSIN